MSTSTHPHREWLALLGAKYRCFGAGRNDLVAAAEMFHEFIVSELQNLEGAIEAELTDGSFQPTQDHEIGAVLRRFDARLAPSPEDRGPAGDWSDDLGEGPPAGWSIEIGCWSFSIDFNSERISCWEHGPFDEDEEIPSLADGCFDVDQAQFRYFAREQLKIVGDDVVTDRDRTLSIGLALLDAVDGALTSSISDGRLIVHARQGSPLAPFTRIGADQWAHFDVVSSEDGVAECASTGERLFSIHLEPSSGVESSCHSSSGSSTNSAREAAEQSARDDIFRRLESSPTRRTINKEDWIEEIVERFPALSPTRAKGIWLEECQGNPAWTKSGPIPRDRLN